MDKNMAFVCDQEYAIVTLIFEDEKTYIWGKQLLKKINIKNGSSDALLLVINNGWGCWSR